ncbi:MAG: hypothetical protein FWE21_00190 [Defluviitaleaceae bacterium]|nr:hypothetical protein [Defluviitaleaceae bacterium]
MRYLTLEINGKLQPLDRGEIYEDILMEELEKAGIGSVDGGGTLMEKDGSIALCDIGISLNNGQEAMGKLMLILQALCLPKGSRLLLDGDEAEPIPLGCLEGLALWLNGTELSEEVYKTCDINHVVAELNRLLGDGGQMYSYWQGPNDTALYFYGTSFEDMKLKMEPFLAEYPLCQKHRIERVA